MAQAREFAQYAPMSTGAAAIGDVALEAPGPLGPLAGCLTLPAGAPGAQPTVIVIPGSGPTDQDGNSPLGIAGAPYRALARDLATRGVASLRIDKRGLFGSQGAVSDPNDVSLAAYADDIAAWSATLRAREDRARPHPLVLLGHSEGGLVAMEAAARVRADAVVLLATPGRPLGQILREQLAANLGNGPGLDAADAAIAALEGGVGVDAEALPAPLQPLFAPALQGFLMDLFSRDPATMAAGLAEPLLIVQGTQDLQVTLEDARRLHRAHPGSELAVLSGMNHVLKPVDGTRADNLQSYSDPDRSSVPALADAVAAFLDRLGPRSEQPAPKA